MKIKFKNSFIKSTAILASGSILAQIIIIITAPLLARLFSPEEIGVYTYVLSVATMFMSVINGRYDMSIVTEEKEELIYPLMKLSFIISILASIVITVGYIVYITVFSKKYMNYLYTSIFMFALLMTYGVINILTAYNNRKKEYKVMTSVYITRTTCQNVGAVILGVFKLGIVGLLLPYTIGQLLGIKRQAKTLRSNIDKLKKTDKNEMIKVLKLHCKQPLYSAPALFVNSFSYSSITFFIEALFGMNAVGFYSISVRILGLPLAVISGNVSRVFFQEASREFNETGQFYKSFKKTLIFLVALSIPMVILMMFLAPPITAFIFGEAWIESGKYIRVLSIMFGIRFIVTSLSTGLLVARKQNYELLLQILFIIASVLSFAIAKIFSITIYKFLTIISISFSLSFMVYFIAIYKCSKKGSDSYVNS